MHDNHPLPGEDVVVDGVRLHVVVHGRDGDEGTAVVLLHGLATHGYLWHDTARDLGSRCRVIIPDLVGLGRSELPERGLALPDQARTLLGLLDALGARRVVLAGHDIGGAVALHAAALAPERVAGLVLLSTPALPGGWPVRQSRPLLVPGVGAASLALLRRSPAAATRVLASALGLSGHGEGWVPEVLAAYLQPLLTPDGARGLLAVSRAIDLAGVRAALALVTADPPPTLVLWGADDAVRPAGYGRQLAGAIPGATFVTVADAGHLLPQDRPERVAEEIAGFLADRGT